MSVRSAHRNRGDGALLLDYLIIGHVTRDLDEASSGLGGTAAYAARTARALECRVGVITSAADDLDLRTGLDRAEVTRHPAAHSTTFENIYRDDGRGQVIHAIARRLGSESVPDGWSARLVHIAPVVHECDPGLVGEFPGAFIGVTPQGWMREWDHEGRVRRRRWDEATLVLPQADAVVFSQEDVGGDEKLVREYARQTRCLALTRGAEGCTIFTGMDIFRIPAPRVTQVDPTGAGDVFAACFFCALQRGYDPRTAARFANCTAAQSVTRTGLSGTPSTAEIVRCRRITLGNEANDAHHLCGG